MRSLLLFLNLFFCFTIAAHLPAQHADAQYWEGVVYFQLEPGLKQRLAPFREEKNRRTPYAAFPALQALVAEHPVEALELAFPNMTTAAARNIYRLEFADHANVGQVLRKLNASPQIAYAERAPKNYPFALPNDTRLNQLWFLQTIEAEAGWNLASGQQSVTVAVVDDAVSIQHEDLADNIWRNIAEINGSPGVDDDGNGYVDDFYGWDGANGDNNPNPPANANDQFFMHGTHVAGTVGAVTNNGRGIASIAYNNAKIIACKGARDSDGAFSGIWEAFAYALANNPDIISNSWGRGIDQSGNPPPPLAQFERALLDEAAQRGIIVLFAAGNENASIAWPAAYESVIAVAATGNDFSGVADEKASYSNFASWVDIAAPGTQVHSLSPGPSRYVSISGTSMATPNTASLLALMKAHAPNLTNSQLVNCLFSSTDNIDANNPNYIGLLGVGRINVRKAIECVSSGNTPTCAAPANLSVANLASTTATLNWNAVSGAYGYNVQIRTVGNSNWFSFPNNPFTNNSLEVTGMTAGTNYEFRVQAVCGQSTSAFSSAFSFTTPGDGGGGNPGGGACTAFNDLYTDFSGGGNCSNNPITASFEVWTNEAYRIDDCVPGQSYTFSICNGYNPNVWEARLTAALLGGNGQPGEVLATVAGCELTFSIPGNFQNPVDVVLVVADANNCGGATQQANNGVPSLSCEVVCTDFNEVYTDFLAGGDCSNNPITAQFEVWTNEAYRIDACVPGQSYTFSFCNGYNPNAWRARVTAVTLQNNQLADVLASVEDCALTFSIPSSLPSPVDVVVIIADANNCGGATQQIDNGTPSLSCTGGGGTCPVPASLQVTNVVSNQATLVWGAVGGSDSYTIQARRIGETDWVEAIGYTDTSIPFSNLLPCTAYEFRVKTQCGTSFSEFSAPFSFQTGGCQSACPVLTNATAATNGRQATISWNGNNAFTEYLVNYRNQSANTWLTRTTTTPSLVLDDLTNCLTYEFQVIGVCASGQGEPTAIGTFDIECETCTPPENISFAAVTPFSSQIEWDAKPIDIKYIVGAKSAMSAEWIESEINGNVAVYSGLEACSDYDIRIKAVCASGESAFSPVTQLRTLGCSGPVYCNAQGEISNFEWIDRVAIGPLVNQSGDNAGYKRFEEFSDVALALGGQYNVALNPGFQDETYEEFWRIWIDLDQDGTFDDQTELVFETPTATAQPVTGALTLPTAGVEGLTTMRVAMKFYEPTTDAAPPLSCTTFEYGEVEDYLIRIDASTNTADPAREAAAIRMFPNPVSDQLTIRGLLPHHQLRVLDLTGRTVYRGPATPTLDLSRLQSGMYFVEVFAGRESILRRKIVKD
jgi:hypothetical protein